MQILAKILFSVAMKLATEKLAAELTAAVLEQIKKSTKNTVDDAIFEPVIKALRAI